MNFSMICQAELNSEVPTVQFLNEHAFLVQNSFTVWFELITGAKKCKIILIIKH